MKQKVTRNQSALQSKKGQQFVQAILSCGNQVQLENFLADVLTESEIKEFSMRFDVARRLQAGERYADIADATGMSSTTIARISNWLKAGSGGYEAVIKDTQHHHVHTNKLVESGLS